MTSPFALTNADPKRVAEAASRAVVDAARREDETLTTSQLVNRCEYVAASFAGLDDDDRADLAADLLTCTGERHGWTPTRSQASLTWLRQRAIDCLRRGADVQLVALDPHGDDADTGHGDDHGAGGILAVAEYRAGAERVTPAPDPDALDVADALALTGDARAALVAALSGWGSALDYADAEGISYAAARKRLSRGTAALRKRYPNPRDLAAAVAAALDALPDAAATGAAPLDVRPAREHGAALDVLRWIDRAALRAAIAAATPEGRTPPNGALKPHAAPLPERVAGLTCGAGDDRYRWQIAAKGERPTRTPRRPAAPVASIAARVAALRAAIAAGDVPTPTRPTPPTMTD